MRKLLGKSFLFLTVSTLALTFVGCSSTPIPKSDRYAMEMTLHKTRAGLEEVKHDLHSHRMETNILEGKMLNQEDSMAALKKETFDQHQAKLDHFTHQIALLEKRLTTFEKDQNEILIRQEKLNETAQEMHKAISQSKDKINEIEKSIAIASKSMNEVSKLKKSIHRVNQALEQGQKEFIVESYRVRSGDTLDAIAKNYGTSVETLCKINRLETEKILAGQQILVPSSPLSQ